MRPAHRRMGGGGVNQPSLASSISCRRPLRTRRDTKSQDRDHRELSPSACAYLHNNQEPGLPKASKAGCWPIRLLDFRSTLRCFRVSFRDPPFEDRVMGWIAVWCPAIPGNGTIKTARFKFKFLHIKISKELRQDLTRFAKDTKYTPAEYMVVTTTRFFNMKGQNGNWARRCRKVYHRHRRRPN